jgi:two-component system response regulator AgrA
MLNIYICDSNEKSRKNTEEVIDRIIKKHDIEATIAISTAKPEDIINKAYQAGENNVYIIDTKLEGNMNGFILGREIRNFDVEGYIIFLTRYIELIMLTFDYKLRVLDYINKEDPGKVRTRLEECLIKCNHEVINIKKKSEIKNLKVKAFNKIINISQYDIEYIETIDSNHKLRIRTASKEIEAYGTLKDIQKQLDNNIFVRCHRSYIVNLNQVSEIDKSKHVVITKSGSLCYVSKSFMKDFIEKTEEF